MDEDRVYFAENAFAEGSHSEVTMRGRPDSSAAWKRNNQRDKGTKVNIGQFTMIPRCLFGSGVAAKLGPSAVVLYVALCERANRDSSNTFRASDKSLASDTDIAPRTICNIRKKLLENRLVVGASEPGRAFLYTLLPQAFEWQQVKVRPRPKRKPRAYGALPKSTLQKGPANRIPPHASFAMGYSKVC